jgi:type III pantothenate kinase
MRKKREPAGRLLLVDVSNSFTKLAVARNGRMGRVLKIPTDGLSGFDFPEADRAVVSSVVPGAVKILKSRIPCPVLFVDHRTTTGLVIRYPKPETIGADRLANAAAAVSLGKIPSIVVDFGTAVTFDVIDSKGAYRGGIIAPGLLTAASALHERTALLPMTAITPIPGSVGKNTLHAIRAGLLIGAAGLVREAVERITREIFSGKKPFVIATGGDAALVSRIVAEGGKNPIDLIDPLITLKGLLVIAAKAA